MHYAVGVDIAIDRACGRDRFDASETGPEYGDRREGEEASAQSASGRLLGGESQEDAFWARSMKRAWVAAPWGVFFRESRLDRAARSRHNSVFSGIGTSWTGPEPEPDLLSRQGRTAFPFVRPRTTQLSADQSARTALPLHCPPFCRSRLCNFTPPRQTRPLSNR